ncbi:MAG: 50S ribosomal protein L30e [Candidatus Bathyarchaeota archaeon BA1]|nr:MAG: 50S ribosomal protein L30e [Candidatus Bathyarchaeota archaeon BA1]
MIDVNKAIATVVRTGKVLFGGNNAIKTAKVRKAKLIIVAANCPQSIRGDIQYYCKISSIPMIIYNGTSIDLGSACGKPFMVSALTIREPGDSDILKLAEATEG